MHRSVRTTLTVAALAAVAGISGCAGPAEPPPAPVAPAAEGPMADRLDDYATFRLTTDLGVLTERERNMIPLLIDAARAMDDVFWMESWGDRDALLASIDDPGTRAFAEINYGPWDRLNGNEPFVEGTGPKPPGAQFYPHDMTVEEFEAAAASDPALRGLTTVVRREAEGKLVAVPYHVAFEEHHERAASKLEEAAALADDPGLRDYLRARAVALRTDDYLASDLAWMDMKDNVVDVVIGPIETYEDRLFGYKAAHEAYVLVKDREWSARLARYAALLPELQRGLPVPDAYKRETPGTDSDLNAYDVLYYAGDCNAGSKTIAINLPNDERVQLEKGTRRLQLKNAMRAKFDTILSPIADALVREDQRGHIRFDSFFENVMFHEVAHGLGIKNTLDGSGPVRAALRDQAGGLEEAKADILGLYMVGELQKRGEIQADLRDNQVTFLAGLFRSIRFGAATAHGRANLAEFRFLRDRGAFARDEATGTYAVDFEKMDAAVADMARAILTLQGDGDYDGAVAFLPGAEPMESPLADDLAALGKRGIPVDLVFEQGMAVLESGD